MSKKYVVLLAVMVVLLATSSVWACPQPMPDFVTRVLLPYPYTGHFDVFRPGLFDSALANPSIELDDDHTLPLRQDSVTYTWNWGDGSANSTGTTAAHTFQGYESCLVTVTASDGDIWNCEDDTDIVKQFWVGFYCP